jgi:predicted ester cyclase
MDPALLVRQWFREVWDEGNEAAIDRLMAPDAKVHGLSGPEGRSTIVGPQHFKPYFRTMRAALGGLKVEVVRTIVQDDMVAAHCRVVARHVGDALGGPPTNRPVEFWGITITRVKNDKLVEGWKVFDFLSMYQQLGWVKAPVLP